MRSGEGGRRMDVGTPAAARSCLLSVLHGSPLTERTAQRSAAHSSLPAGSAAHCWGGAACS